MAKFICMANYGLLLGNFDLDVSDGEIRYKTFIECNDMELSDMALTGLLLIPCTMFDHYSEGILRIIFQDMDAEEAIALCET